MVKEKTWNDFRESGLFWWINMILHTFGWAIVVEMDEKSENVVRAYPARVKFRGFDDDSTTKGYIKVSEYLFKNIEEIREEANG